MSTRYSTADGERLRPTRNKPSPMPIRRLGAAMSMNPGGGRLAKHSMFFLIAALMASSPVASQTYSQAKNFDARIQAKAGVTSVHDPLQVEAVGQMRQQIPDLATSFDERTGVTRTLSNRVGHLSGPNVGPPADVGIKYVSVRSTLLGLSPVDLQTYEVRSIRVNQATGASHVYLRQTAHDLPLYNGLLQINVSRDGRIISVNNAFLRDLAASVNTTSPVLTAAQAVASAAEQIGIAIGPDAASEPRVMLLAILRGEARLVWNLQIETPDGQHFYDFNVDAVTGEIWTRFDRVISEGGQHP